jgi:hypothetical protein
MLGMDVFLAVVSRSEVRRDDGRPLPESRTLAGRSAGVMVGLRAARRSESHGLSPHG